MYICNLNPKIIKSSTQKTYSSSITIPDRYLEETALPLVFGDDLFLLKTGGGVWSSLDSLRRFFSTSVSVSKDDLLSSVEIDAIGFRGLGCGATTVAWVSLRLEASCELSSSAHVS